LPVFRDIERTRGTEGAITLSTLFYQKVLGINRYAYWPVHPASMVSNASNIRIGIATAPGSGPGCYIQGTNGIEIGDYTITATGVGIISADHSLYDYNVHSPCEPIRIGRYCWISMNAVILPGVQLGDHVIVGAGSVVTDSFPQGYCVIAGVPAKMIKSLDKSKVVEKRNKYEYLGFHYLGGRTKEDIFKKLGIKKF
jgi:acetyltransferase-like isoleucine patch superfamily enzyme